MGYQYSSPVRPPNLPKNLQTCLMWCPCHLLLPGQFPQHDPALIVVVFVHPPFLPTPEVNPISWKLGPTNGTWQNNAGHRRSRKGKGPDMEVSRRGMDGWVVAAALMSEGRTGIFWGC